MRQKALKHIPSVFGCLIFATICTAQTSGDRMRFKERIGFDEGEVIEQLSLLDDRSKVLLIGRTTIQFWDLRQAKLLNSYPHEIKKRGGEMFQMLPGGRLMIGVRDRFVPLNLTKDDRPDAALIYDLTTGKQVAALQRPTTPIRRAEWSANGKTIVTFSNQLQKETEISFWSGSDFSLRYSFKVRGYGWHYLTRDGSSLLVGSGGLSFIEKMYGPTTGSQIRVYNAINGKWESEFAAPGKYSVAYGTTFVSPDEKFLATEGDRKILVWDLTEKNARMIPKYEIARRDPEKKLLLKGFSYDGRYLMATEKSARVYYDSLSGDPVSDVPQTVDLRFDYPNVIKVPASQYVIAHDCGGAKIIDLPANKTMYEVRFACYTAGTENGLYSWTYTNDYVLPNDDGTLLLDFEDLEKSKERTLRIRDLKSGQVLETLSFPKKPVIKSDYPKWLAGNWWVKDHYVFAMSQNGRSVLIWETK